MTLGAESRRCGGESHCRTGMRPSTFGNRIGRISVTSALAVTVVCLEAVPSQRQQNPQAVGGSPILTCERSPERKKCTRRALLRCLGEAVSLVGRSRPLQLTSSLMALQMFGSRKALSTSHASVPLLGDGRRAGRSRRLFGTGRGKKGLVANQVVKLVHLFLSGRQVREPTAAKERQDCGEGRGA